MKIMARSTITLPSNLLDELVTVLAASSKTEAVMTAISEELRRKKIERIKTSAGDMNFDTEAEELRHGDPRLG
jgi:hypothetical protein